jgi:hypothetical protein
VKLDNMSTFINAIASSTEKKKVKEIKLHVETLVKSKKFKAWMLSFLG